MATNMKSESESYQYFMRPEPRKYLGPIRVEQDDVLGKTRMRKAFIGMVRNTAAENRREVEVFLDPVPHIRIPKAKDLQGWYKGANEPNAVRPRPCYTEALLTEPYGGYCPVGCIHCYINSGMRGYRGTGLVTVPVDYGKQIEKQLSKIRRAAAGYITSFHDPFNILEQHYHNSERCAEAFVSVGLPIFFLSRLRYPTWAIQLLKKNKYSYAQKSINTSSPRDWRLMSPGAPDLKEQYKDIKRLKRYGIYVSVQVNPVIPGITPFGNLQRLFVALSEAGADHVIVKFVESGYSWVPAMLDRLRKRFSERVHLFEKLFTQNIGGVRTVDEDYRMTWHYQLQKLASRLGMTYSVCYEYEYEKDEEGNAVSKTGVSIGPKVTTSDQCHGRRVPVFSRKTVEQPFVEVRACSPSGCLYCVKDNKGKPQCGDVVAGEAWALRLKDMREPIHG